jgi:DNA-binding response OmpR family regulator
MTLAPPLARDRWGSSGDPETKLCSERPHERVLIVDDDDLLRRAYRRLLARRFEVDVADSGTQGLEVACRSAYDVIVCDLQMPDMDGQRFFELLVAAAPHYQYRVVFSTGGSTTNRLDRFIQSLDRSILEKPCSGAELEAVVAAIIAEHSLAPAPGRPLERERLTLECPAIIC